jgi:NAD(P)-dependent dehydrogenase (short-subunit alcohol dehydrogenase family)
MVQLPNAVSGNVASGGGSPADSTGGDAAFGDRTSESQAPVTVVTGAAGGIGRELVFALLREGHDVVGVVQAARSLPSLLEATSSAHFVPVVADLTSAAGRASVVQTVADRFGGLTALINNAGIGMSSIRPDYYKRPIQLAEIDDATLAKFLAINAHAPIALALALLPLFNAGWGRIVNVGTSLTAMMRPGFLPYAMSKAALESASAVLAHDLQTSSITVNMLNPGGPVDTPMARRDEASFQATLIPAQAMAPPICWLASRASAGTHGRRITATRWRGLCDVGETDPIGWPQLANDSTWAPNSTKAT